ncbi:MAG: ATP-binding protein [Candidatus Thiodiazotropha lotti]|uniref:histidine kinase n=1 Tax=Candidatus Thiodiazotropha endoloripes TaxID=1818881 RepID=A0A1E2US10_9GAMM|nr:ATP-binding protein [Candidatus Thiodiazotropha endoloripes]MCG7897882.1 ATP-binding protein [Candidatus Thiodiazotropha weberae]MCG7990360.1 ATP-binding protein [Candidatus Thiodiazotropha lotti]MCG7999003.1 ATP-binding protein [Candidatus Thiodiazotropha lotti]MCW4182014.1 ATP-binding protein [Candidatus Thiodiazotropha weberae]MCW4190771.1 ATP-binding protein [Candidatus Thiodiazotropha weberae]
MIIRSIRLRLLVMISLSILLLWGTTFGFTWWRTSRDINLVYDAELKLVAELLAVATEHELEELDLEDYQINLSESGYDFPLLLQVWSDDNKLVIQGPGTPGYVLTSSVDDGYSDSEFDGEGWRVYTLNITQHNYRIHVARGHAVSEALVSSFVQDVVKPLLIVLPLSGMLWFIIQQGFRPLRSVSRLIGERDYDYLNPVTAEHIPEEVADLVDELNALLKRLKVSIERNNRFTADVAHELRTPIAGMLVQMQSSVTGRTDAEREKGLTQINKGLNHLNHVVNQLLILASIEPEKIRMQFEVFDLISVAEDVMSDISPMALSKRVEMELIADDQIELNGNREMIAIMLSNLVTNAMKFTPSGNKISVSIKTHYKGVKLAVEDSGPGIPDDKKKWVFERLNRLPGETESGSGLGLSIVKEICELHQGNINLQDRKDETGLIVNLFLPQLRES